MRWSPEAARNLTEDLRAASGDRDRRRRPTVVEDVAGGDPIVYDDERDEAASNAVQQFRS